MPDEQIPKSIWTNGEEAASEAAFAERVAELGMNPDDAEAEMASHGWHRYVLPNKQPGMQANIVVRDPPAVRAELDEAANTIERLRRERDEWEERYEDLLSRIGGTAP